MSRCRCCARSDPRTAGHGCKRGSVGTIFLAVQPDQHRLVPDCRVFVGGKPLDKGEDGRLVQVEVELDVDLLARCELAFLDPRLELIDSSRFSSGTPIRVEIGFAHKLQKVFEGEVVALEPRFLRDLPPTLHVIAQDSLHRLALSQMTRALNNVDDHEILKRIAQEHGLSAEGPPGTKGHHLQANVTDAVFLRRLAQKQGNHLRIEGKKLVIAPPPKRAEVVLDPASGIRRLKVSLKSVSQVGAVAVHGWDPKAKREIVATAKPEGEKGEGAKKFGKGSLAFAGHEQMPPDVATAEAMAKGRMRKLAEGYATLHVDVTGDPRLLPGASAELQKLGPQIDGAYRVEKALHRFNRFGYVVSFRATRTSKQSAAAKAAGNAAKAAAKAAGQQTAAANAASRTKQATYVALEIRDEKGKAIPGARYELVSDAGRRLAGVLGPDGKARVENLEPGGKWKVRFPDYPDDSWRPA